MRLSRGIATRGPTPVPDAQLFRSLLAVVSAFSIPPREPAGSYGLVEQPSQHSHLPMTVSSFVLQHSRDTAIAPSPQAPPRKGSLGDRRQRRSFRVMLDITAPRAADPPVRSPVPARRTHTRARAAGARGGRSAPIPPPRARTRGARATVSPTARASGELDHALPADVFRGPGIKPTAVLTRRRRRRAFRPEKVGS